MLPAEFLDRHADFRFLGKTPHYDQIDNGQFRIRRMKMERLPKVLHSPEFRAEAVKLLEQTGISIDRKAQQLSIPKSSLSN